MAYQESIRATGQGLVSTLNGRIQIEEGLGRLVVYDGVKELTVLDEDGFTYSDGTDRRIRTGNSPSGDRVGNWISDPGDDVIDLLEE